MRASTVLQERRITLLIGIIFAAIPGLAAPVCAEVRQYDVIVKAIDPIAGTVMVNGNGRDVTFRVQETTKIRAGSEDSTIDELVAGAQARISFETTTGALLSIETDQMPKAAKERTALELKEISASTYPMAAWPSEDGLRIYWEAENKIWRAERKDVRATFGEREAVVPGRHPSLTADELEIVLSPDRALYSARRQNADDAFERPRPIKEFASSEGAMMPCFSRDGLKLYFIRKRSGEGHEVVVATRADRESPWTPPRVILSNTKVSEGGLSWPFVSEDGLSMLMTCESSPPTTKCVVLLRRESEAALFQKTVAIDLPGIEANWRAPRYVAATGELFLTRFGAVQPGAASRRPCSLWIVEGIDFP